MANIQPFVYAWYNSPLVVGIIVAIVTIVLTLMVTQRSAAIERERDRRERAEALKASFWGEINSNRRLLGKAAKDAFGAWEGGEGLSGYILDCPKVIYKANAEHIGDLRDAGLARRIVNFYSIIELWEAKGKELQKGAVSPRAFPEYVYLLVNALHLCVILDMQLSKHTEHLKGEDLPVVVSQEDVTDRDFCLQAESRLKEKLEALD